MTIAFGMASCFMHQLVTAQELSSEEIMQDMEVISWFYALVSYCTDAALQPNQRPVMSYDKLRPTKSGLMFRFQQCTLEWDKFGLRETEDADGNLYLPAEEDMR